MHEKGLKKHLKLTKKEYLSLIDSIETLLEQGRKQAYNAINTIIVKTYWEIGKNIVEYEQAGKERAEYGSALLDKLSKDLVEKFGKGFSRDNLEKMRKFYYLFKNSETLSRKLSWSHYCLLLRIEPELARQFYLIESEKESWSVRELERQINSLLYERVALSKDKEKVKELSLKGQVIEKPEDAIKDPYVLEFLGIKENAQYLEKDLEKAITNKLKEFLLELGKGFSFIERQKRITVDGDHYYIDLVFYNYILKCFFLIDLKIGKLTHQDIGQMDFYVRYFEKEQKLEGDNPTVGLILCSDKNEIMAKYTLLSDNKRIFASKYKLYLPTEDELKKLINKK